MASATKTQVWTTPGADNFTVPANVYLIKASLAGAGAGGDRDLNGNAVGGRGGGAAETATQVTLFVTPGDVIPLVVGAAGAAGFYANHTAPSGGSGAQAGGNSSFREYVAVGGGRFRDGQLIAPYGGGPNGGLQTSSTFPVFADTFALADATLWFGGSGAGTSPSTGLPKAGTVGGPSGGRPFGGAGGAVSGTTAAGGGGAATPWGPGGDGGNSASNGNAASNSGTGGGGAGGTSQPLGTGPFHDGAAGADGRVQAWWIEP